ncbi:MAG: type III-A CRISPR-associated RAMP protein Csm5 [Syntrophales bacterium]|nr:type III-A CRISPR-associated RAMP protein Csm5 [Syntrophales bacterium]
MVVTKRCFIKVLTPVHIGCDEVYEPFSFVVDERERELVVFDPLTFFKSLKEEEKIKFDSLSRKGTVVSLLELMKFMRGRSAEGFRIPVSEGFVSHYNRSVGMPMGDVNRIQNELNRFAIMRTAFNPHNNEPYLPGSSIKGSLRTAYLNMVAKKKPPFSLNLSEKGANRKLEQTLLDYKSIETDPFRLLKVSDFVPVKASTRIVYAVNVKKDGSSAGGLSQILEIIEPGSFFVGTISVDEEKSRHPLVNHQITFKGVLDSLRFFEQEKLREEKELRQAGINECSLKLDGGRLIRVGRHSGAESVTIEGYRKIRIRGKREYDSDKATTVWLASEVNRNYDKNRIRPFGWCQIGEITPEIEKEVDESLKVAKPVKKVMSETVEKIVERRTVPEPVIEEWPSALLTWDPGKQELKAEFEGKRAIHKGKDIIPENLRRSLIEKRKSVNAKVTIEKVYNRYSIVRIEGES